MSSDHSDVDDVIEAQLSADVEFAKHLTIGISQDGGDNVLLCLQDIAGVVFAIAPIPPGDVEQFCTNVRTVAAQIGKRPATPQVLS